MAKEKFISLTGKEFEEFKATGKTSHTYGGITYDIEAVEGWPVAVGARILASNLPEVDFASSILYARRGEKPYKG